MLALLVENVLTSMIEEATEVAKETREPIGTSSAAAVGSLAYHETMWMTLPTKSNSTRDTIPIQAN